MDIYSSITIPVGWIFLLAFILFIGWLLQHHGAPRVKHSPALLNWVNANYVKLILVVGGSLAIGAITAYLFDIMQAVYHLVDRLRALSADDTGATADIRDIAQSVALLLGVLAASATLIFSLIKVWTTERSTRTSEEALMVDQLNKALENLGAMSSDQKPNIVVRTGALLTLERIAQSYPKLHQNAYDLVGSHISAYPHELPIKLKDGSQDRRPLTDLSTALDIIARRRELPQNSTPINLMNVDLSYYRMKRLLLVEINLTDLYALGIFAPKAVFHGSSLRESIFNDAELSMSIFCDTDLSGAQIKNASLVDADLSEATLHRTDFTDTDLKWANFLGSKLHGADLSQAKHVTQEMLDSAYGDAETKIPTHLTRPAHWGS